MSGEDPPIDRQLHVHDRAEIEDDDVVFGEPDQSLKSQGHVGAPAAIVLAVKHGPAAASDRSRRSARRVPLADGVLWTYIRPMPVTRRSASHAGSAVHSKTRRRAARLGFRVDADTKALVERAAEIERRSLTDFCLGALTDAARKAVSRQETLVLSDRDRAIFFEVLANPPEPNERLKRAFARGRAMVAD